MSTSTTTTSSSFLVQQLLTLTLRFIVVTSVVAVVTDAVRMSTRTGRHRRAGSAVMPPDEVTAIVDIHNKLRRQEGASDMQLMTWNEDIAVTALAWAERCNFSHGQVEASRPPSLTGVYLGQNLYITSSNRLNVTWPIEAFYNEKVYYTYDSTSCVPGQMCGHYTQVVWATSRQVGCAKFYCRRFTSTTINSGTYLVCNYGPGGNYRGAKPYTKGQACSQCNTGNGWCADGLCNVACTRSGPNCQCRAVCCNGATLNGDSCTCSCADGWYGNTCSVVCEDTDKRCSANPGWPKSWCNHVTYGSTVRNSCPAMCELCKKVEGVKPSGPCINAGGRITSDVLLSTVAMLFIINLVLDF